MLRNAPYFLSRIACCATALLLLVGFSSAQSIAKPSVMGESPARLVNYSGKAPITSSVANNGLCGITFAIYREETGGAPLWLETQNVTLDESGRYNVLLGSTTSGLPDDLFPSDQQRWLGVQLQGQPEQSRVLLASVPYAIKAMEADKLSGHSAGDFVTTETLQNAVQQQLQRQVTVGPGRSTVNSIAKVAEVAVQDGAVAPAVTFSDNNASQVVSVQQSGTGVGLSASATSNSAIVGTSNASAPNGILAGVEGISSLDGSFGIYGRATSTSGTQPGIGAYGQSDSPNGIGIVGRAVGTGNTTGLVSQATSPAGFAINASETATSGNTVGVAAQIFSPIGIGMLILNNASGPVTGSLISARTKSGVQFSVDGIGNVNAAGSLVSSSAIRGKQLFSTAASGTSPLQVNSTTQVPNLNVSLLGGLSSAGFVQNRLTTQSGTSFNVDGNGTIGGTLAAHTVNTGSVQVAGPVTISGSGNGITFPDGTTQNSASQVTLSANVFTGTQRAPALTADTSTVVGSNPNVNGQAAIMPDNLDTVHQYWGQAGQNMHFRLSSAQPGPGGSRDFLIAPYTYGMAIEYAGVLEAWVDDFSVHTNHRFQPISTPARFWVGDEGDTGGLFVTAFHNGGTNSYTVLASDRFAHTSHGPLVFQVRDPVDSYKFQWGAYNSEVTRASFSNTATATNLNLTYGPVQGTVTADSNGNGAINIGSVSATPLNLVAGNTPMITAFPDGNVSIGNQQDSARLSVGSSASFSVNDAGAVAATSMNLTSFLTTNSLSTNSLNAGTLALSGAISATDISASGTVTASAINATSLAAPIINAASVTSTSSTTNSLSVTTTATAASVNSNALATNSLSLGNGTPILGHISVAAVMDFAPIPANSCVSQTVALAGAANGDTVALGIPDALGSVDGTTWFAWVNAPGVVSIRGCNATLAPSVDPPPASIRVDVWKH